MPKRFLTPAERVAAIEEENRLAEQAAARAKKRLTKAKAALKQAAAAAATPPPTEARRAFCQAPGCGLLLVFDRVPLGTSPPLPARVDRGLRDADQALVPLCHGHWLRAVRGALPGFSPGPGGSGPRWWSLPRFEPDRGRWPEPLVDPNPPVPAGVLCRECGLRPGEFTGVWGDGEGENEVAYLCQGCWAKGLDEGWATEHRIKSPEGKAIEDIYSAAVGTEART